MFQYLYLSRLGSRSFNPVLQKHPVLHMCLISSHSHLEAVHSNIVTEQLHWSSRGVKVPLTNEGLSLKQHIDTHQSLHFV